MATFYIGFQDEPTATYALNRLQATDRKFNEVVKITHNHSPRFIEAHMHFYVSWTMAEIAEFLGIPFVVSRDNRIIGEFLPQKSSQGSKQPLAQAA